MKIGVCEIMRCRRGVDIEARHDQPGGVARCAAGGRFRLINNGRQPKRVERVSKARPGDASADDGDARGGV